MENDLISVIMTVYNRENYVKRALDSVVSQNNVNIEFIIVDDGSNDSSPLILDEYAQKYDFIRVIHITHGGLSVARNTGLDNASGDYIFFIDDDDFLPQNALYDLLKRSRENNADLVIGNYAHYNDNNEYDGFFEIPKKYCNRILNKRETCELLYFSGESHVLIVSWGKLYKKKVWNGVRFPERITKSEDQFVFASIMGNCDTIYFTDEIVYNQLFSQVSITRSKYDKRFLYNSEGVASVIRYLMKMQFYDIAIYKFGVGTRSIMDLQGVLSDDESVKEIKRLIKVYKRIAHDLIPYVDLKNKFRMIIFETNYGLYKRLQRFYAKKIYSKDTRHE